MHSVIHIYTDIQKITQIQFPPNKGATQTCFDLQNIWQHFIPSVDGLLLCARDKVAEKKFCVDK